MEKKLYKKKRKIISVTEETLKVSTKPAQLKTIYTLIIIMKIRPEILYNHLFLSFFSDLNSHRLTVTITMKRKEKDYHSSNVQLWNE